LPTPYTFSLLLASLAASSSSRSPTTSAGFCDRLAAAGLAHAQTLKCGALAHPVVTNCLLKLYCALGMLPDARRVFDTSGATALDAVSWNTMVSGYGKCGDLEAAREVFDRMPERAWFPGAQ
jgi:pentatricopeptide repeat protein